MGIFRSLFGSTPEDSSNGESKNSPKDTEQERSGEQPGDIFSPDTLPTLIQTDSFEDHSSTRQLPVETVVSYSNKRLQYGQASDMGLQRDSNEDAILSYYVTSDSVDEIPDFGIFIVADGMGGHNNGEVASAMTARIVADSVIRKIYMPILAGKDTADMPPIAEVLIDAITKANAEVHKVVEQGGTTCTTTVILRNRAYIAHVGDSRAYLVKKGEIEQITVDHSVAQRLKEIGQITDHSEVGNKLYRAVGFKEELEVDAMSRNLSTKAALLLCSDGLWGHVDEQRILEIVESSIDAQTAVDRLVAQANTNGGSDNISVILVKMN